MRVGRTKVLDSITGPGSSTRPMVVGDVFASLLALQRIHAASAAQIVERADMPAGALNASAPEAGDTLIAGYQITTALSLGYATNYGD